MENSASIAGLPAANASRCRPSHGIPGTQRCRCRLGLCRPSTGQSRRTHCGKHFLNRCCGGSERAGSQTLECKGIDGAYEGHAASAWAAATQPTAVCRSWELRHAAPRQGEGTTGCGATHARADRAMEESSVSWMPNISASAATVGAEAHKDGAVHNKDAETPVPHEPAPPPFRTQQAPGNMPRSQRQWSCVPRPGADGLALQMKRRQRAARARPRVFFWYRGRRSQQRTTRARQPATTAIPEKGL